MNFSTYVRILDLYQDYGQKGSNMEIGCNIAKEDFVFYMSGEKHSFRAGETFLVDGYNQYMLDIEGHPAELVQEIIYHPRGGKVEIKDANKPNDSPGKAALRKHRKNTHGKTNTYGR